MWQSAALLDTQEHPASARRVRIMRVARLICSLLLALGLLAIPVQSRAQVAVGISVQFVLPVLQVSDQLFCPVPGFFWVLGFWVFGPAGSFWFPARWWGPP